ncbi:hypothetical protein SAMD00019534_100530, partial [Acytostelium subglobosum LB1]|uniref:hypothetical protein n=1 Tax=Acytostelium subglobosum LB1 TaxID=1410327 RepID=UPI000644EC39
MNSIKRITSINTSSLLTRSIGRVGATASQSMFNNNSIKKQSTSFLVSNSSSSSSLFNNIRSYSCHNNEMTGGHCHKHTQEIRIRKPAPAFTCQAVVNGDFKEVSLSDYKGKYVYLFFYPLDFTFVCPTEIIAFSDKAEEFRKIGCEILACSIDSQFSHLAWINTPRKQGGLGGIHFPILSDITHQIAKDYGVYIPEDGHTIRGSFIIDGNGIVKQITLNDNPVGRSVEEALRLVQAFQYTDVHGEVCPANWRAGEKTMIPDPVKSQAYFNSVN